MAFPVVSLQVHYLRTGLATRESKFSTMSFQSICPLRCLSTEKSKSNKSSSYTQYDIFIIIYTTD